MLMLVAEIAVVRKNEAKWPKSREGEESNELNRAAANLNAQKTWPGFSIIFPHEPNV